MTRKLDSWITGYLAYTAESEGPELYHKWVAISTIASALRRRVFYDMSYFLLYPNVYIVLVGPAGVCKKSTSMAIARRILKNVQGVNFSVDSVTRERLILDIGLAHADGHSSMTAFSSEFGSLLTSSGIDMVVFLTDIYDSPEEWAHKTKQGGTNKIVCPCFNLISGTTPDYLAKTMPLDTIGIGLMSRTLFVHQDVGRDVPMFPDLNDAQEQLREILVHDLNQIALLQGEYVLEGGLKEEFNAWHKSRRQKERIHTGDPRLRGYFARKPMHLLKLCMSVAASMSDELVITHEHFQRSMAMLEELEESLPKVFANVGKNPLAVDYDDVMATIQMSPTPVSFAQLIQQFKHSVRKDELNDVIETLAAARMIRVTPQGYLPVNARPQPDPGSDQS